MSKIIVGEKIRGIQSYVFQIQEMEREIQKILGDTERDLFINLNDGSSLLIRKKDMWKEHIPFEYYPRDGKEGIHWEVVKYDTASSMYRAITLALQEAHKSWKDVTSVFYVTVRNEDTSWIELQEEPYMKRKEEMRHVL